MWVDQHEPGPHTLWPEALGLFVPLNIIAFFTTKLRAAQLHFQIGLFVVFVVSNIVVFQPWEVRLRSCQRLTCARHVNICMVCSP